jgi:Fem-1 family protein b
MEADSKFIDEVYSLLIPAVRQGDIDSVENYFSTVSNPDEYLNQVYDEENMQKCTLLTIACLNRHENIIHMLLHRYKPDLEITNNILFGDRDKTQQMCSSVTVLWVAAAIDNFPMVKLLVEHGANINHTTKTNSTPLRSACYNGNVDIARYLIANGADIHIAKENNDTNLAVSVYRKHLVMATYLVDELGCDVNMCDNDGRSPLYDAVNCGSLELVEFLLNHGARNFRAKSDQMSPLMWAAEKRRVDLMNAIASHCTLIEQIEAEELLGSVFACTDLEDRDYEQSFEHFTRALELRSIHNLPKTLRTITTDLFDHRQECQTIDQLKELHSNPSDLCIEALLIRERLLGPNNTEYRYSLRYYGALLADNDQHYQAIAFWMYELGLRQEYSIDIDPENLRHFVSMFSEMIFLSLSIPIEALLTVIKVTAGELKCNTIDFDFNFYTLLFLITITSQVEQWLIFFLIISCLVFYQNEYFCH